MQWSFHLENGPQRVNHASVALYDRIFTFGGYCSELQFSLHIDIHCFNTSTLKWSEVFYDQNIATPPSCYGHSVVAFEELIYLWGGQNSFSASNVLSCFNPRTLSWSEPPVSGHVPPGTDGHSACVMGEWMYVFGGFEEATDTFSDRVYRCNLRTFVWQHVRAKGDTPSPRDFHTASAVGDRMYVFGGRSSLTSDTANEFYCRDVVYLDTALHQWVTPKVTGEPPTGRRSHAAALYNDEIYIIGGLEGETGVHLNDVHKFNPALHEWTRLRVRGTPPTPRRRHCAVTVGEQLYLFGGSSPFRGLHCGGDCHDSVLQEHSDLFVLDFFPTLKRLCQLKIITSGLNEKLLPRLLQREILSMQPRDSIHRRLHTRSYTAFAPAK